MYRCVRCEFRMEGSREQVVLPYEDGFACEFSEDLEIGAYALDDRSPDENHFHRSVFQSGWTEENVAGDLAAVGIAKDGHVHQTQRTLRGIFYFRGEQDCAGAGAKDGPTVGGELANGVRKAFSLEKLKLRCALAAGKNQTIAVFKVDDGAHLNGIGVEAPEHRGVGLEITLNGKNSDFQLNVSTIPFGGHDISCPYDSTLFASPAACCEQILFR